MTQGPQAEVGLPVELFYTCWPCGGLENVLLFVPGRLVMDCPLALHVQARLSCQGRHRPAQATSKDPNKEQEHEVETLANISSAVSIESLAGLDWKWFLHQHMSHVTGRVELVILFTHVMLLPAA